MLTKSRIVQILFMMIVLVGLFFWRTFESQVENKANFEKNIKPQVDLLRCDYKSPCEFITEQGIFLLSIKDIPIQAEEWIDFELSMPIDNSEITKAQIVGKTMFMGRIPVRFKNASDRKFTARGLVGACTTDEMIWQLQINVVTNNISETLLFDFAVKK
jgi:hypothetical protein